MKNTEPSVSVPTESRLTICKGSYEYDKEAQKYSDVCSLCGIHSDQHPEEITLEDSARQICASLGILPALSDELAPVMAELQKFAQHYAASSVPLPVRQPEILKARRLGMEEAFDLCAVIADEGHEKAAECETGTGTIGLVGLGAKILASVIRSRKEPLIAARMSEIGEDRNGTGQQAARNQAHENVQAENGVPPSSAQASGEAGPTRNSDENAAKSLAGLPVGRQLPDEAFIEAVESEVGMGCGAWDMVDAKEICAAVLKVAGLPVGESLDRHSSHTAGICCCASDNGCQSYCCGLKAEPVGETRQQIDKAFEGMATDEAYQRESARLQGESTRWISVEEKLPEVGGTYLVAVDEQRRATIPSAKSDHNIRFGYYVIFEDGPKWSCTGVWPDPKANVTHWQELPELPKPPGLGESREPLPTATDILNETSPGVRAVIVDRSDVTMNCSGPFSDVRECPVHSKDLKLPSIPAEIGDKLESALGPYRHDLVISRAEAIDEVRKLAGVDPLEGK